MARGWKGGNHIENNQGYEILKSATFDNGRGFALGYNGGVQDSLPLICGAFAVWGAAGALAVLVK